jgi:sensor histidine kinase YesM
MFELIITAIKVKRISKIFILFFSFFFLCALLEILIQSNLIDGDYSKFFLIGSFCLFLLVNMAMIKNFVTTIKTREITLIESKNAKQKEYEAELNFLKSQIRPHFIHNALNAIISISRTDADRARSLLVDFSSYLRNCFEFENSGNLVSIDREINFVRSYIAIEKARFGDRLHIYYDIETHDLLIPPLILQPLVENAVQHGIKDKQGEGTIIVYVHIQGNLACIGVKDDGVGISAEIINNVLEGVRNTRGIGLYNINQRLNKIYHTSLQIQNLENGGTNISMILPI